MLNEWHRTHEGGKQPQIHVYHWDRRRQAISPRLFFATAAQLWYLLRGMHNIAFITNFLSGGDGIIILVAVLIIFGPKKLPELARGMGQAIREFQKAKDEVTRELTTPPAPDVTVQPAPGQQPRQPAELAAPAQPVAAAPFVPAPVPVAPAPQVTRPVDEKLFSAGDTFQRANPARPVEDTHPAGQA